MPQASSAIHPAHLLRAVLILLKKSRELCSRLFFICAVWKSDESALCLCGLYQPVGTGVLDGPFSLWLGRTVEDASPYKSAKAWVLSAPRRVFALPHWRAGATLKPCRGDHWSPVLALCGGAGDQWSPLRWVGTNSTVFAHDDNAPILEYHAFPNLSTQKRLYFCNHN